MVESTGIIGTEKPIALDNKPVGEAHIVTAVDGRIEIDNPAVLFLGEYERTGDDLSITHMGETYLVFDYFGSDAPPHIEAPNGAFLNVQTITSLAGDPVAGRYAQLSAGGELVEIGTVLKLEGTALSTSVSGTRNELSIGSKVYQGDVVETGDGSTLGIVFSDKTVFSMSANARMILDELIYDPNNIEESSMSFNLVQGAFVFVTGEIAPSGNMNIDTPVATMGIRGTTPRVVANAALGAVEFTILEDPGKNNVGEYFIINKSTGEILARVASAEEKWVVTGLYNQPVKITKSGLDLLEDEKAYAEIADLFFRSRGDRTEIDGSNNFPKYALALDAIDGQLDGLGGPPQGFQPTSFPVPNGQANPPNKPPVAADDSLRSLDNFALGGGGSENIVIANNGFGVDIDPEGYSLVTTQVNGQTLNFVGSSASVLLPSGAILLVGRDGSITYDPNGAFNLKKGQTAKDTFQYTIQDNQGLTDTGQVTVEVVGTANNIPPTVTVLPEASDVSETFQETDAALFTRGSFKVEDVEIADIVVVENVRVTATGNKSEALAQLPNSATLLSMFSPLSGVEIDATTTVGTVDWSFNGAAQSFDYLAAGEAITLVYTITVHDGFGGRDRQDVIIDIAGTNDQPTIVASTSPEFDNFETLVETNSVLQTSGTFEVADLDLSNAVTAMVIDLEVSSTTDGNPDAQANVNGNNFSGLFSLNTTNILAKGESSDILVWSFESATADQFDYLAKGEELQLVYTIQIEDDTESGLGNEPSIATKTVTIKISGANDQPGAGTGEVDINDQPTIVALVDKATIIEDNGGLSASGKFVVADNDVSDILTARLNIVTPVLSTPSPSLSVNESGDIVLSGTGPDDRIILNSTLKSMFALRDDEFDGTAGPASSGATIQILDSGEINDVLHWDFNSGDEAFDFLAVGESLTLTVEVEVIDDNKISADPDPAPDEPSSSFQTIVVKIKGTNDQPELEADVLSEASDVTSETPAVITAATLVETNAVNASDTPPDDGRLTVGGTFSVRDVDTSDVVTASVTQVIASLSGTSGGTGQTATTVRVSAEDVPNDVIADVNTEDGSGATYQLSNLDLRDFLLLSDGGASFTTNQNVEILSNGEVFDTLHWQFASDVGSGEAARIEAFDFLSAGEELTLTYQVTVKDDSGAGSAADETDSIVQTIVVKIKGTNDQPELEADVLSEASDVTSETPAVITAATLVETNAVNASDTPPDDGRLTVGGTFSVRDVDTSDVVTASVTQVIASLSGTSGGTGQTATTVRVSAEDVPNDVIADVNTEDGSGATYQLSNLDLRDFLLLSDGGASFTTNQNVEILSNGEVFDTLHWQFASDVGSGEAARIEAFDFLSAGEELTLTYQVTVKDDSGAGSAADETDSIVQTIVVKIKGTNDQPELEADVLSEASDVTSETPAVITAATLVETNAVNASDTPPDDGRLTVGGTFSVRDVDTSDVVTASVTQVIASLSGTSGGTGQTATTVRVSAEDVPNDVIADVNTEDGSGATYQLSNLDLRDFLLLSDGGASFTTNQNVEILSNGEVFDTLHWQFASDVGSGEAARIEAFDFLSAGEELTLTYQVTVKDDSGAGSAADETDSIVQTIVVKIKGTNDQPELEADVLSEASDVTSETPAVITAATLVETNAVNASDTPPDDGRLTVGGTFSVRDVDTSDVVTASVTQVIASLSGTSGGTGQTATTVRVSAEDVPNDVIADVNTEDGSGATYQLSNLDLRDFLLLSDGGASFTTNQNVEILSNGEVFDTLHWQFASDVGSGEAARIEAFDFLSAGEELTLTYQVTVKDDSGAGSAADETDSIVQTIVVKIKGTNDQPELEADVLSEASDVTSETPAVITAATLVETNAVNASDTPPDDGRLTVGGTFSVRDVDTSDVVTASVTQVIASLSGTSGGTGQTATTVRVSAEDVPNDVIADVNTEDGSGATYQLSNLDLRDFLLLSDGGASFTTNQNVEILSNGEVFDTLHWQFASDVGSGEAARIEAFDFLSAGEELTLTYQVTVKDDSGAGSAADETDSIVQTIVVKIKGTNDQPELEADVLSEASDVTSETPAVITAATLVETNAVNASDTPPDDGRLTVGGTFSVRDVDTSDVVTASVTQVIASLSGTSGGTGQTATTVRVSAEDVPNDVIADVNTKDGSGATYQLSNLDLRDFLLLSDGGASFTTNQNVEILSNGEVFDTLHWQFASDVGSGEAARIEAFDFLSAGEELTLTYQVTVKDDSGAGSAADETDSIVQTIVVKIKGTNDQPELEADVLSEASDVTSETPAVITAATLVETNAVNASDTPPDDGRLTVGGTFSVRDVDTSDVVTASVTQVIASLSGTSGGTGQTATTVRVSAEDVPNDVIADVNTKDGSGATYQLSNLDLRDFLLLSDGGASFTTNQNVEILSNGEVFDTLHWQFASDVGSGEAARIEAFDFLSAGEELTLTYQVTVKDDSGAGSAADETDSIVQTIVVKIKGTNDQPELEADVLSEASDVTSETPAVITAATLVETNAVNASDTPPDDGRLTVGGTFSVRDVDTSDVVTASVTQVIASLSGTSGGTGQTATTVRVSAEDVPNDVIADVNTEDGSGATYQLSNLDLRDFLLLSDGGASFTTNQNVEILSNGEVFDTLHWQFASDVGSGEAARIEAFDFLSAGEELTLTYQVTVKDDSGAGSAADETDSIVQTIVVKIKGTNDQPELEADVLSEASDVTSETPAVITAATLVETNAVNASDTPPDDGRLTVGGTFSVRDVDTSDVVTASVTQVIASLSGTSGGTGQTATTVRVSAEDVPNDVIADVNTEDGSGATYQLSNLDLRDFLLLSDGGASFTTNQNVEILSNGEVFDTLHWQFASDVGSGEAARIEAFDFLSAGEELTLTYQVTVKDDSGAGSAADETDSIVQTIVVKIKGTNDQPELEADVLSEASDVTSETPAVITAATLVETNAVNASDTPPDDGRLTVGGTFSVRDVDTSDVVTASVTQVIASLSGTSEVTPTSLRVSAEDVPNEVIAGESAEDVSGAANILLSNLDLRDFLLLSDGGASFTTNQNVEILSNGEVFDTLHWQFASDVGSGEAARIEAFDFLSAGEELTLTYQVTVKDDSGAGSAADETDSIVQTIVVKIKGTNDEPTITGSNMDSNSNAIDGVFVDESLDTSPIIADIGNIYFNDIDLNDIGHTAIISSVEVEGRDGDNTEDSLRNLITQLGVTKVAGSNKGVLNPEFNAPASMFSYLEPSETVTLTYTLMVSDGDGGIDTSTFDVTITGVDSSPQLSNSNEALASYIQGDGAQIVFPNVEITDDNTTIDHATIYFTTDKFDPATDILGFVSQNGISGSYDQENGVLKLSGVADLSFYQAALQTITFSTGASADISVDDRQINFTVNDGISDSNVFSTTVSMTAAVIVPPVANEEGNIVGTSGNDYITNANEDIFGGSGNDILQGTNIGDTLYGEDGNDFLLGGVGRDELFGGDGDDILDGGRGVDQLTGGSGSDVFVFAPPPGDTDAILDFTRGEDILNVDALTDDISEVSFDNVTSEGATLKVNSNSIANITFANPSSSSAEVAVIFDANEAAVIFNVAPTG